MAMLIAKYAITALVIVLVSEVAKRSDRLGALIASLPIVTVMVMIWLHIEKQPSGKIANHAYYTFWYVLPTMPMFLLMPWMLRKGFGFWPALGSGCVLTFACFALAAVMLKRFGIGLMP
jgi:F0F1-type ATP synthase assembly protein I